MGGTIPRLMMKDALSMLAEVSGIPTSPSLAANVSSTGDSAGGKPKSSSNSSSTSSNGSSSGKESSDGGVHAELFESPFLKQTRSFYKEEMKLFFAAHSIPECLVKMESRLIDEESRADGYLTGFTKGKLRQVMQEELILAYSERIVNDVSSGVVVMLKDNSLQDLERCYLLFSREPKAMDDLRRCMGKMVTEVRAKDFV